MPRRVLWLALLCVMGLAGCLTEKPAAIATVSKPEPTPKRPHPELHDHDKMLKMTRAQVTYNWGTGPHTTYITFWYSPNSGRQQTDVIVIDAYNMISGSLAESYLLATLFGYSGPQLKCENIETPDAWYHIYELPSSSGAAGVKVYFDATQYHGLF